MGIRIAKGVDGVTIALYGQYGIRCLYILLPKRSGGSANDRGVEPCLFLSKEKKLGIIPLHGLVPALDRASSDSTATAIASEQSREGYHVGSM